MKDARQNQRGRPPPIRLGGDVPGGTADSDNSRAESIEMMSPNKRLIERIKNRSNRSQNDIDKSRESLSKAKRKEALRQKNSGPQSRDERHDNDGDLIEEEQDVSRNKEEKENLSLPITDILQPMHIFPVDIFRLSRNRENATQPLLYNPYSHPLCFEQSHTTNAYCLCSPFCSTDMLHREPKRREGTWEIENYDHMHGRNGVRHDGADDVDESTHLLDSPARQDRRRNPSSEIDPSVRAIEMTSRHQADIRKVGDCDASFTLELKSPIRCRLSALPNCLTFRCLLTGRS
ncbi:unnamed protein product [Symbiodinium microadriaticum]|nr:unnamed protein product [Symbiodinium microadriaticum]